MAWGGASVKYVRDMADVPEPAIETQSDTPSANDVRCVFCRIAAKDEQAEIVYEDEDYVCFRDRSPAATHHYLLIPRQHIRSVVSPVWSLDLRFNSKAGD